MPNGRLQRCNTMEDQKHYLKKSDLLGKLEELGISSHTVEHEEVFTVKQSLPIIEKLQPGLWAKNLFLCDKKKNLWLFCAPHSADVKLNELAKQVGAPGGLRFADEKTLFDTLGVRQGCVTIFALINDREHKVRLILDKRFGGEVDADDDGVKETQERMQGGEELREEKGEGEGVGVGERRFYFHPLVNSASTGVTLTGLKAFLEYTGHKPVVFQQT